MLIQYDKKHVESRAKYSLDVLGLYNVVSIVNSDKPDLQDVENSVGIEVVQDCYEKERKYDQFIFEIWDTPFDQIPKDKIARYRKNGGSIKVENNKIVSAGLDEFMPNDTKHLVNTIKKKVDLLNSGGCRLFDSNRLYVVVETISVLFNSYVASIIGKISELETEYGFDTIYLDHWFEMIVCDMRKGAYTRQSITKDMRDQISKMMRTDFPEEDTI